MSKFLDLPDEKILKVLSYLKVRDLLYCGQVSKRIRAISHDKSLYQKINLNGKKVQTRFLERIINKGCKHLNLSGAQLEGSYLLYTQSRLFDSYLLLNRKSQLISLNLDFCAASKEDMGVLTNSCVKLQKISMRNLTKFSLTSNMIKTICNKNGQTLEVLNLENYIGTGGKLSEDLIQFITEKCVVLKEVNLNNTGLSYDSIDILTKNLTPNIQNLSLRHCYLVNDWHIGALVKRCNHICVLDLKHTAITSICLPDIFRNLKDSLVELNIKTYEFASFHAHENSSELLELKFLTRFKILHITVCGFMEKKLKDQLPGIVIDNNLPIARRCC